MKTYLNVSLTLAGSLLATTLYAQQPTQTTANGNASPSTQRNTSSTEGLNRRGGVDVGTRGSQKMKDGVSRSGNSNLSPTGPTSVPPPGGDKPGTSAMPANGPATGSTDNLKEPKPLSTRPKPRGTGTRNGNAGSAETTPVNTQGSTSEGNASAASAGGAPGTNTRVTRSVRPKSRAAALETNAKQAQPSAAGLANSASKTGKNGKASPGSSSVRLTERGQQEGSYSDAAKRNKTTEAASKVQIKPGATGQKKN